MYEQVLYGIYATLTEERVLLFGYTGALSFNVGGNLGSRGRTNWQFVTQQLDV